MSRQNIVIAFCSIVAIALVVWLVSPSREERAQEQLDAAYKVEQAGEFDQAISQYEQLVREYQGTEAAEKAVVYIERVERYKERRSIQEVRRNLDRVALVLNGYREMLGTAPTSLAQLDNGSYMFDSNYIAEIPPEGFTYYLVFKPAETSFVLFSRKDGAEKAVQYDAGGALTTISAADLDRFVKSEQLAETVKGRMVFLQPLN